MIWIRNSFVYILSSILFFCLFFGAFATSINLAIAHPNKIEGWLNQGGVYTGFINYAIKQASTSTNDSGGISLSDTAVQDAAKNAFPISFLQKSVNTVLDSNYAWLEGKSTKPSFLIDLSTAKQTFAQQIGAAVSANLASLPVCSATQARALTNYDPLTVTCRPSSVGAVAEGNNVAQQILTGSGFLSNPVFTADNITQGSAKQPYYLDSKISLAPKAYQLATKLPWAIAALGLLSGLGVIFASSRKRKGLRRVALSLTYVGVILVASRYAADYALKKTETKVFNTAIVGYLQQSMTSFAHLVETQIVKITFDFGVTYIVLAVLIFVALLTTHGRVGNKKPRADDTSKPEPVLNPDETITASDIEKSLEVEPVVAKVAPKTPKPPTRLVQ